MKAVLFDLDNTLIHFDEDEFFVLCMDQLYSSFTELITRKNFDNAVFQSAKALIFKNDSSLNTIFFSNSFSELTGMPREEVEKRFLQFEMKKFDDIRTIVTTPPRSMKFSRS